jgi:gamma-glutamylputrescine oxidase
LARHGARVTLLERHRVGWGARGRKDGFVLTGYQPEAGRQTRRYGFERARALFEVTIDAIRFLESLETEA